MNNHHPFVTFFIFQSTAVIFLHFAGNINLAKLTSSLSIINVKENYSPLQWSRLWCLMEQPAHPPIYSLTAPDACWEAVIEKTKKKQINQAFKCNMDNIFHFKHTFINIPFWSSSCRKERSYIFYYTTLAPWGGE